MAELTLTAAEKKRMDECFAQKGVARGCKEVVVLSIALPLSNIEIKKARGQHEQIGESLKEIPSMALAVKLGLVFTVGPRTLWRHPLKSPSVAW